MRDDCPNCGVVYNLTKENTVLYVYGFTPHMTHWGATCPNGHEYALFSGDIQKVLEITERLEIYKVRLPVPPENVIELYRTVIGEKIRKRKLTEKEENQVHAFADILRNDEQLTEEVNKWRSES